MIGQLLAGHYKVLQVLGEGGFGQTYIVEDIHLPGHPQCVLKHLQPPSKDSQSLQVTRKLFQKEAETLQQLGTHEQIPRLLAYFEENQEFYLIQEYICGHLLKDELLPGESWIESQVIEMLIEILKILEVVHGHGVIHRDIKPDNIIRRKADGKLVLIDFGAIKQLRNQTAIASGGQRMTFAIGTPGYMPSEQTRRLPRSSSDIYALGMVGIQALTGINPRELLDDPETGEVLWQHIKPISPGLIKVIEKMTRYHFKDRYQTASEALQALQELADLVEAPTVVPTQPGQTLHELTLTWKDGGEIKTYTILETQNSKNPGRVRIGRDPLVCDIVIPDLTVSALHAEIFFHQHQNQFYLRNLRQKNPPILDGKLLLAGEMPLQAGSSLRLGKQSFKVQAIAIKKYPVGCLLPEESTDLRAPTGYEPVVKTAPPQKIVYSRSRATSYNVSIKSPSPNKQLALIGSSAIALSLMGGLAFLQPGNSSRSSFGEQNAIALQPQCREINPTGGSYLAKLRPEPQTEVGALKQLSHGEKVLLVKVQGDFAKVQLADGTEGWLFVDQVRRCHKETAPSPFPTPKPIIP